MQDLRPRRFVAGAGCRGGNCSSRGARRRPGAAGRGSTTSSATCATPSRRSGSARCGCCARRSTPRPSCRSPPLVNDPLDAIQLEAIAAELSFFLVETSRHGGGVGLFVEVRNRGRRRRPSSWARSPTWPRAGAARSDRRAAQGGGRRERARAARSDLRARRRSARPPLAAEAEQLLIKALDHYDPAVRAGAARVFRPAAGERGRRRP